MLHPDMALAVPGPDNNELIKDDDQQFNLPNTVKPVLSNRPREEMKSLA